MRRLSADIMELLEIAQALARAETAFDVRR
jgi:hypothetical protein